MLSLPLFPLICINQAPDYNNIFFSEFLFFLFFFFLPSSSPSCHLTRSEDTRQSEAFSGPEAGLGYVVSFA